MPEMTSSFTAPIGPRGERTMAPIMSGIEQERYQMYRAAWLELEETGWKPASVVNLHPWKLYSTGILGPVRELKIPGVPRDADGWASTKKIRLANGVELAYVKHVFELPDVTVLYQVHGMEGSFNGSTSIQKTLPRRFAQDIHVQNNTPEQKGGVFWYEGSHDPLSNKETYGAELEAFAAAHAQQMAFYNRLLDQANQAHAEKNVHKMREIQQYHRWAAKYLRILGLLPADPEWLTQAVRVGPAVTKFCVCGAEVKTAAVICKECNYVLEPFDAFDRHVVALDTAGAKLLLKRLTTDQIAMLIERGRFSLEELEEVGFVRQKDKPAKEKKHTVATS